MILVTLNASSLEPFKWQIGDKRPYINMNLIESIEADGKELAVIKSMFGMSIPIFSAAERQMWYGDFARTILHTLVAAKGSLN
jgi:hypothetical protein